MYRAKLPVMHDGNAIRLPNAQRMRETRGSASIFANDRQGYRTVKADVADTYL
jgi:hypothetical protein